MQLKGAVTLQKNAQLVAGVLVITLVNTAPGLTGTTLEKYVEMFKEII